MFRVGYGTRNIIRDFTDGDRIEFIDLTGGYAGLNITEVIFNDGKKGSVIKFGNGDSVYVQGPDSRGLTKKDFQFAATESESTELQSDDSSGTEVQKKTGFNKLAATSGADTPTGTAGNDWFDGDDTVDGGAGDDVFVYHGGIDTITDFAQGDTTRLRGIDNVDAFGDFTLVATEGGFKITFSEGNTLTIVTDETGLQAEDFDILDLVSA